MTKGKNRDITVYHDAKECYEKTLTIFQARWPMKEITGETTIGEVIEQKGAVAGGQIMDDCFHDAKDRCPRSTVILEYAASSIGKAHLLPDLLKRLNALPDITR